MKKVIVIVVVALLLMIVCSNSNQTNGDFLRIHIRADSNDSDAQQVKYQVKNAVVDYLAPYLCEATTKQKAMQIVSNQLRNIEKVCNQVLAQKGFDYQAKAKLCQENFPDRKYDGITLPQGVYDALIVELGSGKGDNWWCVVYPPLCFVGGENNGTNTITFKSKLWEIIQNWKTSLEK